jgi:cell division septation protein DedD
MTQADEKELVLGNKQLISLFFVVAALCGVFFAMGYMIGRNSTKGVVTGVSDSQAPPATPPRQQPEPPRETASAQPDANPPASGVETRPAQDSGAVPPKEYVKETAPVKPPPAADGVTVPETGASYLQVTALARADADNMIRTLREQSFPVILAESSKDGLYRVLVGPYHQTAQIADAKNRLKTLGFASAFVQKQ